MKRMALSLSHGLLLAGIILLGTSAAVAITVDFDDHALSPESYWNGPDPEGTDVPDPWGGSLPIKVGAFESGCIEFVNRYNLNYDSWSGFAYSNTTNTTTPGHTNQFSAYTGSGCGPDDDNYGIAYGYEDNLDPSDINQLLNLPFFEFPIGASIKNAYITNTTYAMLSMLNGDQFAKKFGGESGNDPDWFKMTAYGTDAAGNLLPNTVELFLADYRFSDNSQDYTIDEWTLVDFSSLADAKRLYFNMTSTDVGSYGLNTPAYFAIDNIVLTAIPGDANLDGVVDNLDAAIVGSNWQTPSGACWGQGDFDANGTVDAADATIMAANWQNTSATANPSAVSVPEPGVFAMLLLGGACVLAITRRKVVPA